MQIHPDSKIIVLHVNECINTHWVKSMEDINLNNLPFAKKFIDKFIHIVIYMKGSRKYLKDDVFTIDAKFTVEDLIKANELNRIPVKYLNFQSLINAPRENKVHFALPRVSTKNSINIICDTKNFMVSTLDKTQVTCLHCLNIIEKERDNNGD